MRGGVDQVVWSRRLREGGAWLLARAISWLVLLLAISLLVWVILGLWSWNLRLLRGLF